MSSKPEGAGARACWFVGASYGRTEDQTPRFLREGIWENGYQDKYLETVKSIQVGDRIAIKSSYTRKLDLPFDNRSQTVSVMSIKAIGTVKENYGDGRTLRVDWKPYDPPREWYFLKWTPLSRQIRSEFKMEFGFIYSWTALSRTYDFTSAAVPAPSVERSGTEGAGTAGANLFKIIAPPPVADL